MPRTSDESKKKTDAERILDIWKCPTGEKQEKEMPFTHSTWL